MGTFAKIIAIMAQFCKYAPYALAGVQAVESAVGAGNGADKKQIAVAAVLAAAHAGETVPVAQVQVISAVVDTVVGTLNAAGLLGKTTTSVTAERCSLGRMLSANGHPALFFRGPSDLVDYLTPCIDHAGAMVAPDERIAYGLRCG